jgi:hypothetical protein
MDALTPENLTHRGTVAAEAFLLPAQILSREEMRRRVLSLWRAGAQIFRLGDDLIVRLPDAVRIDSRRSPGLPFVRYGRVMSAFPLEKKDLADFRDSGECLIFLDEGNLKTVRWQDLKTEDVGEWFDTAEFQVIETETLGGEAIAAITFMKPISEADLNIRGKLEDVPAADSQLGEIIAKLKELRENQTSNSTNSLFQSGDDSTGAGGALGSFFTSVYSSFKNLFASGGSSSGADAGYTKQSGQQNAAQPEEPGVLAKLYNRLRHLAVNAVIEMRMAHVFGRRQAKYIAEMMEKFERGDLSEALKYAIPLEDMQALQNLMQKPTSLFLPRPRSRLSISFGRNANGSSINLGDEWFNHLRQMYRQSFERLEAQGRIEEASFVLAELLKSNAEAVEFLAKHGKYRLAAELAEARNLPKETIVRQWYLAGEKMRAVRLAILHDCFEYAVTKLEQENSETGAELRQIWAESLAAGGNFPAAVDVIWKLEAKRARAEDWIEKTIEYGGAPAGRMLARKAMLFPEHFDEVKEKFREILKGGDFEAVEKRNAFARAVFKQNINDELRTLLRPLIRKISSDAANTSHSLALKEFRELVVMAKDNALRTDLPTFPQAQSPPASSQLFEISVSAADKGASFIYDACVLPDGKIVAALGESGVKIFSANAKQIAFFDQPAHKLVVSDFANKAIALAKRGETTRLARIDFIERRANYWCDAKLNAFAPNFDGNIWFVGSSDEFYAIDANGENFEALWRVPDVGGAVYAAVRSKTQAKFLTLDASGFETWWYELPSLTLRSRNRRKWLENAGESVLYSANISEGAYSVVIMQQEESEQSRFYALIFDHEHLARKFEFPPEIVRLNRPEISNQYSALTSYAENKSVVNLFFGGGDLIATFSLEDARNVSTKFDENYLTIADDCGRLLAFDYKNRALRHNLRL